MLKLKNPRDREVTYSLDKKLKKICILANFSNICSLEKNYFCTNTDRLINFSISFTEAFHCAAQKQLLIKTKCKRW